VRATGTHISSGGRNAALDLRARNQLTQDHQLAAHKFGAFTHALQAVVPLAPISSKKLRVDTLSIISDTDPELLFVIPNFDLYLLRPGVPEGTRDFPPESPKLTRQSVVLASKSSVCNARWLQSARLLTEGF